MVAAGPDLDLASNDPLVGYLLSAASAVDITGLQLQSPALKALQAGRRGAGGPADLLGQPGGPAQPGPEKVRTRILDR